MKVRRLTRWSFAVIAGWVLMTLPAFAAQKEITVQAWGINWQSYLTQVAKNFEKETGIRVNEVTQSSSGQGLLRLQAVHGTPVVDVWFTTNIVAARAATDHKLFTKIPIAGLSNVQQLIPAARNPYWVAAYQYPMCIVYRTDEIKEPLTSWHDLWNPQFKRDVALPDMSMFPATFLITAAMINGGSIDNIQPGFAALKRLRPNVALFYSSDAQVREAVAQGEAPIAVASVVHYLRVKQAGIPVAMDCPPPSPTLFDVMMLLKGGHVKEGAEFIDFASSVASAELATTGMGNVPVNPNVKLDKSLSSLLPTQKDQFFPSAKIINAHIGEWTQQFDTEIAK